MNDRTLHACMLRVNELYWNEAPLVRTSVHKSQYGIKDTFDAPREWRKWTSCITRFWTVSKQFRKLLYL